MHKYMTNIQKNFDNKDIPFPSSLDLYCREQLLREIGKESPAL